MFRPPVQDHHVVLNGTVTGLQDVEGMFMGQEERGGIVRYAAPRSPLVAGAKLQTMDEGGEGEVLWWDHDELCVICCW